MRSSSIVAKALASTLTLVGALGLANCSSEEASTQKPTATSGGGGSDVAAARQFFMEQVYPSVVPTCGNGCHNKGLHGAPEWLADSAEGTYSAIEAVTGYIASPTASPLLQKGIHSGPALKDTQATTMEKWLTMEVNARKLSGSTGKPPNLRAAFKQFGDCMSYKRWMELKLNTLCDVPTQGAGGTCKSCHIAGQSSLWLSPDGAETFTKFTQYPYVQKLVVGRVSPSGSFDGLEGSRRLMDKGTEARQPQANTHPLFTMSTEQVTNISLFVNETLTNMTSGNCQGDKPPDAGAPSGK